MSNIINVGMADLKFTHAPYRIRTSGLGSCVGLIVYDERAKRCGLAHIMLPESSLARNGELHRPKYADTAVDDLVNKLIADGSPIYRLKAKMAGGAQMFNFSSSNEVMRIGPRNSEAVRSLLDTYKIKLVSEDIGGNSGRTIEFNPDNSMLEIKTINQGTKDI